MSDEHSHADLTEATASGLRWISVARVFTELLLLGSMVVLARLIPPAAFGMFAIAIIVQELAINLLSEGVGSALVQRKHVERAHIEGGFALALVIGSIVTVGALLGAVFVVKPVFGAETAELAMLTTPWCLVSALGAPSYAMLRLRLDFRRLAFLDLTNSVMRSITSIVLAAAVGLDGPALVLGGLAGVTTMTRSRSSSPRCRSPAGGREPSVNCSTTAAPRRSPGSPGWASATATTPSSAPGSALLRPVSTGAASSSRWNTSARSARS